MPPWAQTRADDYDLKPALAVTWSAATQTVGKLRKHTDAGVRKAAAELVDLWKGVVDRSVGRQGADTGRQGGG